MRAYKSALLQDLICLGWFPSRLGLALSAVTQNVSWLHKHHSRHLCGNAPYTAQCNEYTTLQVPHKDQTPQTPHQSTQRCTYYNTAPHVHRIHHYTLFFPHTSPTCAHATLTTELVTRHLQYIYLLIQFSQRADLRVGQGQG